MTRWRTKAGKPRTWNKQHFLSFVLVDFSITTAKWIFNQLYKDVLGLYFSIGELEIIIDAMRYQVHACVLSKIEHTAVVREKASEELKSRVYKGDNIVTAKCNMLIWRLKKCKFLYYCLSLSVT